jgi:YD repeat-containing protein
MRSRPSTSPLSLSFACLILCSLLVVAPAFNIVQSTSTAVPAGADKDSAKAPQSDKSDGSPRTSPSSMFQGGNPVLTPGSGLPDLNDAYNQRPGDPPVVSPTPSDLACEDCVPCSGPNCDSGSVNHAPIPNAGGPYSGQVGESILFNGLGSYDIDARDGLTYHWDFGDGTSLDNAGPTPVHTYHAIPSDGSYQVHLTVTDQRGLFDVIKTTVNVSTASPPASYNLAYHKPATQSKTYVDSGGNSFPASLAVDGNTNSDFNGGLSCATTSGDASQAPGQSYWQVDLGSSQQIGSAKLWPRTDCCPDQLSNIYLLVSDQPFASNALSDNLNQPGVWNTFVGGNSIASSTVGVNHTGRYVRVQKSNSSFIVLAEVEVWSAPSQPPLNDAQFVSQSVPQSMTGGESYNVSVSLRNTGQTMWTANRLYRLGSKNGFAWGRARVALPHDVGPGEVVTFNFNIIAPRVGGGGTGLIIQGDGDDGTSSTPATNFQWQMEQDITDNGWFGQTTDNVGVNVSGNGANTYGGPSNISTARLDPANRTGEPGVDLRSGNYNWDVPMLGLPGRAGLDLDLSLTYNSLVWTRVNPQVDPMGMEFSSSTASSTPTPTMVYDADRGFPGPGFRIGFPSLQGPFYNDETNRYSYLMIMPSGRRVELRFVRQDSDAATYESVDSSYLRLTGNGVQFMLRSPDGTQMTYTALNHEFRCVGVKDRNGNYLSVNYNASGRLKTVTDTVGRNVTFNYDTNMRLLSITQERPQGTHTWATFGYQDIVPKPNFRGPDGTPLWVQGMRLPDKEHLNGFQMTVLGQVWLDDGSVYHFDYNEWGQVYQIRHHAADNHQLNLVRYDLPLYGTAPEADCPRFTTQAVQAENWANNGMVQTSYSFALNGSSTGQATMLDGTVYREIYGTENSWSSGLVVQAAELAANPQSPANPILKKTTITEWSQDSTNASYPFNPHLVSMTVSEPNGNQRKTKMEYEAGFGPPTDIYEYDATGAVLRRTHTDYNLDAVYLNHNLLGLVRAQYVFGLGPVGGLEKLYRKTTYEYDDNWFAQDNSLDQLASVNSATQHDLAFDTSYIKGRGNLTSMRRWDVTSESDSSQSIVSSIWYNTAGQMVSSFDPGGHSTKIGHADSNGGSTYAYVTRVVDADGNQATSNYRYDIAKVSAMQGPPPAGSSQGATQSIDYYENGRIKQVTAPFNGVNSNSYTKWYYPLNQTIITNFSTVEAGKGETYSAQVLDGSGRLRATAQALPDSEGNYAGPSSGTNYTGQYREYDLMGRAVKGSNPTEMNNHWQSAGDDSAGWLFSQQTYDWKGRPLVSYNTDLTSSSVSYEGCGCAGSAIATMTDEAGHQQKVYHDSLGRETKIEVLDENHNVYTSHTTSYNVLDQVVSVKDHQGAVTVNDYCPTFQCQGTDFTYDGHGRLKSRHLPEQETGKDTTYDYNSDDTVQRVKDAREATTAFTYNGRHLVTSVVYGVVPGVAATNNVDFNYDAAGNRQSMTEKDAQGIVVGGTTYAYDPFSKLQSETRYFSELANTQTGGHYTIGYDYNLAGQLTGVTDPVNSSLSYTHDAVGQLTKITGSSFADVTQYATGMKYRAWGALKQMNYGNNLSLAITYNARLQASAYNVPGVMLKTYDYYPTGQLRSSTDFLDARFDRLYVYDHADRVTQALSGLEARGPATTNDRPYKESFQYDWNDHMSARPDDRRWITNNNNFGQQNYVYNRNQAWIYDVEGNLKESNDAQSNNVQYNYDAASRAVHSHSNETDLLQRLDGDGQSVRKEVTDTFTNEDTGEQGQQTIISYQVRSSVLSGQVLTELDRTGQKSRTFVYEGDSVLATQQQSPTSQSVLWEHRDLSNASYRVTNRNAMVQPDESAELDPLNTNLGTSNPVTPPSRSQIFSKSSYPGFSGLFASSSTQCIVDYIERPCSETFHMMHIGIAEQCQDNNCGPRIYEKHDREGKVIETGLTSPFQAFADGFSGFLPYKAKYLGNGEFRYGGKGDQPKGNLAHGSGGAQDSSNPCPGSIPDSAGRAILTAADAAHIDPTLLSVTWRHESGFDPMPKPNPRKNHGKIVGYDVGPLQLSTNYYDTAPYTTNLPKAFTGNTFSFPGNPLSLHRPSNVNLNSFNKDIRFNGDTAQSLLAGARAFGLDILPRSHGIDEKHRLADAAGKFRGDADYIGRYNQYLNEADADHAFFDCLRKNSTTGGDDGPR